MGGSSSSPGTSFKAVKLRGSTPLYSVQSVCPQIWKRSGGHRGRYQPLSKCAQMRLGECFFTLLITQMESIDASLDKKPLLLSIRAFRRPPLPMWSPQACSAGESNENELLRQLWKRCFLMTKEKKVAGAIITVVLDCEPFADRNAWMVFVNLGLKGRILI